MAELRRSYRRVSESGCVGVRRCRRGVEGFRSGDGEKAKRRGVTFRRPRGCEILGERQKRGVEEERELVEKKDDGTDGGRWTK